MLSSRADKMLRRFHIKFKCPLCELCFQTERRTRTHMKVHGLKRIGETPIPMFPATVWSEFVPIYGVQFIDRDYVIMTR